MAIKVAINGFGRIGRCTLRAIYEQGLQNEFDVVAINAAGVWTYTASSAHNEFAAGTTYTDTTASNARER